MSASTANTTPIFPSKIANAMAKFTIADGLVDKVIDVAGPDGMRIDSIIAVSTDPSPTTFYLYLDDGTELTGLTGNTTSASNTIGMTNTTGITINMTVHGAGIPGSAVVTAIVPGTSITISANASVTAASVPLTFVDAYKLGEFTAPALCGTVGAVKAYSVLNKLDFPWLPKTLSLYIAAGYRLRASAEIALTSGAVVSFITQGGEY